MNNNNNHNLLQTIDSIDDIIIESEINVINALFNSYNKALTILENYNGDDLSSFSIFQEEYIMEEETDTQQPQTDIQTKKQNIFKRMFEALKKLISTIASKIKSLFSKKEIDDLQQKMEEIEKLEPEEKKYTKQILGTIIGGGVISTASIISIISLHKKAKRLENEVIIDNAVKKYNQTYQDSEKLIIESINKINNILREKVYKNKCWINFNLPKSPELDAELLKKHKIINANEKGYYPWLSVKTADIYIYLIIKLVDHLHMNLNRVINNYIDINEIKNEFSKIRIKHEYYVDIYDATNIELIKKDIDDYADKFLDMIKNDIGLTPETTENDGKNISMIEKKYGISPNDGIELIKAYSSIVNHIIFIISIQINVIQAAIKCFMETDSIINKSNINSKDAK